MCLISLLLEVGRQFAKNGILTGVKIGYAAAKSGKNTRLLAAMHVSLSKKVVLQNFMNRTRFKKVNG